MAHRLSNSKIRERLALREATVKTHVCAHCHEDGITRQNISGGSGLPERPRHSSTTWTVDEKVETDIVRRLEEPSR